MTNTNISVNDLLQAVFDEFRKIVREEIRAALEDAKNAPKKMYSREEASQVLHITIATLCKWEKQGLINGVRVNRRVLFSEDEISRVLNERTKRK